MTCVLRRHLIFLSHSKTKSKSKDAAHFTNSPDLSGDEGTDRHCNNESFSENSDRSYGGNQCDSVNCRVDNWMGYLQKKSPSAFKGWQRRLVGIDVSGGMTYKKSKESHDKPKEIPLVGAVFVWSTGPNANIPLILKLHSKHKNNRVYKFGVSNTEDKEKITIALKAATNSQNFRRIVQLCEQGDDDYGSGYDVDDSASPLTSEIQEIIDSYDGQSAEILMQSLTENEDRTLLHICASRGSSACSKIIVGCMKAGQVNAKVSLGLSE